MINVQRVNVHRVSSEQFPINSLLGTGMSCDTDTVTHNTNEAVQDGSRGFVLSKL